MGQQYYYISHFGIKDMKWGVRRFQNPDGSLTELGRQRYGTAKKYNEIRQKRKETMKTVAKTAAKTAAVVGAGALGWTLGTNIYYDWGPKAMATIEKAVTSAIANAAVKTAKSVSMGGSGYQTSTIPQDILNTAVEEALKQRGI